MTTKNFQNYPLSVILKNTKKKIAYNICINCLSWYPVHKSGANIYFSSSCSACINEFFPQGDLGNIDDLLRDINEELQDRSDPVLEEIKRGLENLPSRSMPDDPQLHRVFSNDTVVDVRSQYNKIYSWLFDGDKMSKSFLSHYFNIDIDIDKYVRLSEDITILICSLLLAKNLPQRYLAVINFCKLRGSRIGFSTTLCYIVSDLFGSTIAQSKRENKFWKNLETEVCERVDFAAQSEDHNPFSSFRAILDKWDLIKDSQIWKKTYKLCMYVLSSEILEGVNINFKQFNFDDYEAKIIKRSHKPGMTMIHCIFDTILFICERSYDCIIHKDPNLLFQSGKRFEKWMTHAQKLLSDGRLLNNPEPHGINRFKFVSDLKDCIEKGTALIKYTSSLDKAEKMMLMKLLNDLQLLESNELTRREAQKPRKDPFGILIHGSSSICKSQLKQILFYHYGKIFDLPTDAEYMYTRCPTDEFWSGFNSTQWCIVMDDIAFLLPNGELDPTLAEMLQVKNSVPYTPPQASLEDKGRTPVKAELVIGTTNTKHLNLHAYFACPFAIARRMSYVVTATIKPEYAKYNIMADSSKIPVTPNGEYMNIWNFTISEPRPNEETNVDAQKTKYVEIEHFSDINDFLVWYITKAKEHEVSQAKALAADNTMSSAEVCKVCFRLTSGCTCVEPQSENHDDYEQEAVFRAVNSLTLYAQFQLKWLLNVIRGGDLYGDYIDFTYELLMLNKWLIGIIISLVHYYEFKLWFCSIVTVILLVNKIWFFTALYYERKLGSLWKYRLAYRLVKNEHAAYKLVFQLARHRIRNSIGWRFKKLLTSVGVFMGLALLLSSITQTVRSVKESQDTRRGKKFNEQSSGSVPQPHAVEKPTFYYHDPYKVTNMEISSQSKCSQGTRLYDKIEKNVARFQFRWEGGGCNTQGLNVHGCIWIFNKHCLKASSGQLNVIFDPISQNLSRNVHNIKYTASMFRFLADSDVACIELRCISPGSNLVPYFPLDDLLKGNFLGDYLMISNSGERSTISVVNIIPTRSTPHFFHKGYVGCSNRPTQVGDCGAPMFCTIGTSQVILGIHCAGNTEKSKVVVQHVSQSMLKGVLHSYEPQVERSPLPIDAPGYPREIIDVHPKSCLRFVEQGTAHVVGSFAGYRPKHKSKVEQTYIHDYVVRDGYSDKFGAPNMSWVPWNLAINDMVATPHCYDESIIRLCEDSFFKDISSKLSKSFKEVEVYTLDVALNGVDGVTYVDKLNTSTSAGNPFKKSKKNFLTENSMGKIIAVDQVILDRVKTIEEMYYQGKRFNPQFCNHLKDEALPLKKVAAGKTRVFCGGEMAWSLVVRRFLLSHIRLIQNNPFVFEAMPGVIAQSTEWRDLHEYLIKHGKHKMVAGDYAKFDKKMAAPFILSAFNILIRIAQAANWEKEDIMALRCIAYDTAFPWMDFNGDLIEVQGNPSGHPLTVIINCLVNSLYMRYAFHSLGYKVTDFQKYVSLATYGDDNIMGVSDEVPNFHHTNISMALEKMGVVYTMAEKEAASIPYIHIDDCSFLKRKFVFDKDIGTIVAPLEEQSIHKMLTTTVRSKEISPQAHSICVIETALREYFFYGKEMFEERRAYFSKLIVEAKLSSWQRQSTIPHYSHLIFEFWMRTGDLTSAQKYSGLRELPRVTLDPKSDFNDLTSLEALQFVANSEQGCADREICQCCMSVQEHSSCDHSVCDIYESQGFTYDSVPGTRRQKYILNVDGANIPMTKKAYESCNISNTPKKKIKSTPLHMEKDNTQKERKMQTIPEIMVAAKNLALKQIKGKKLKKKRKNKILAGYCTQSEPVVSFVNHEENEEVGVDATNHEFSKIDKTSETELGLFLSRPVRINNFTWAESSVFGDTVQTIYPWKLWADNQYVKLKLNNYSWFRGDLCIRVQMVASPFYYGMIKAIYTPLQGLRSVDNYDTDSTGFMVSISQRPHLDLEVGEADSYVIRLPFIYYKNWVNIQSATDMESLGKMFFVVYAPLDSASSSSSSGIGINTYAWVENVEISGASAGYAMQSDEYGEGPVSKPASWVASAAQYFEDIPVIGPFATATRIGASAVSSIASLFGWTNVPVIEDTRPMRSEAYPKFASSEIGFPIEKLTLDPKNELSVDPRIIGLDGEDEMVISSMCQRESFLTTADFATSNNIDDILFFANVNPQLYYNDNNSGTVGKRCDRVYPTPMAHVAQAFREWRGSIIFRFKVVCSKYHKGKLRISFDPSAYNTSGYNIYTTANTTNIVHTAIVDLTETKDVEFVIPYQQAYQFLATRGAMTRANQLWGVNNNSPTFSYDQNYDNGCLTVRVLTPLTAPISASTVKLLVFVKAGPDIEFANPKTVDTQHTMSFFAPQSEWVPQSHVYADADQAMQKEMAPTVGTPDNQYLVHYGENIRSLRQLLRRTEMTQREGVLIETGATKYQTVTKTFNKMPLTPGYQTNGYATANGLVSTSTSYAYNFANMTWLSYFSNAYLCYRGSTHWYFNVDWAGSPLSSVRVYKNPNGGGTVALTTTSTSYSTANSLKGLVNQLNNSGASGQAVTDQRVQPAINTSAPNYTRAKFQSCDPAYANKGIVADGSNADTFYLEAQSPLPSTTNSGACVITSYVSAGTDFGLFFYLNAPMIFLYASAPTPN